MIRLKKFLGGAALVSLMSLAISFQAMAARIAFSDPSAEAGSEVTVTMKISAGSGESVNSSNVMLSYDASALQFIEGTGATGDAGSIRVAGQAQGGNYSELAFSLKFKALKPGTTAISISTQEVYDRNGRLVNVSQEGKSSVTITGEAAASDGARLSDLKISPGTLSPAFSPDTESYTAIVGGDADQVAVSALAADEGASVSVSGNEDLALGDNEIVCTVTAAGGQTRTYRILVTKVAGDPGAGGTLAERVSLKTYERELTVLSSQDGLEVPAGFVQCSITIDGQAVQGWIWGEDENPEYCIFYAVNEDGESGFYRYDLKEKTLQRHFQDSAGDAGFEEKYNAIALEYNALVRDFDIRFWIIIVLIAVIVILLIVIIYLALTRGRREDFMENRDDGWDPEPRKRNKGMAREDQYLRVLEGGEEAERDEYAFARRVQPDEGSGAHLIRGTYQGENAGSPRGGASRGSGDGRAMAQPGQAGRGAVPSAQPERPRMTDGGGPRGSGRQGGGSERRSQAAADGSRALPANGARAAAWGGVAPRGSIARDRGQVSREAAGAPRTGRSGQPGPQADMDDDFETIDLR